MKFSLTWDVPEGIHLKPQYSRHWPHRTSVRTIWFLCLLLICQCFFYLLVYIKVYHFTQTKVLDLKKYPHWEKNYTPFLTQPIPWIPNWTGPQIKQNMALWQFCPGIPGGPPCPARLQCRLQSGSAWCTTNNGNVFIQLAIKPMYWWPYFVPILDLLLQVTDGWFNVFNTLV